MLTTAWGPVGTRGGCGAGWGPGACPDGNAIHWGLRGANSSHPNQDKHQALSSTPPHPLSLQDPGPQAPQPGQAPGPLIHSTPPLVPTGPWAASTSMDRIPRFGRQHSLEENISLLDWMVHPCKHYNRNRKKKILVEPGNIWTSKIGVNHLTKQPASHRLQPPVNIEASASLTTLRRRSRRPRRAANLIICQGPENPWI